MKRKVTVPPLCVMLFALSLPAEAQQPKKIHPETAKQIGLTIPPEVLARANKIIKR